MSITNPKDVISTSLQKVSDALNQGKPKGSSLSTPLSDLSRTDSIPIINSGLATSTDSFFRFSKIDPNSYNQSLRYELQIVDKDKGVIAVYTFPIPPQNINKSVPTAETIEATMKGVYGTSNGAPFRQISISGTSGIVPIAVSEGDMSSGTSDALKFAFKNVIKSWENLENKVNRAQAAISSTLSGSINTVESKLNRKGPENILTGYQTIHDLQRFLDFYLASKKVAANKNYRLVFIMGKDKEYYACILNNYAVNKSAGTLEYTYNINLTAYKRYADIKLIAKPASVKKPSTPVTNKLASALEALKRSRDVIAGVNGVLAGVRSDINETLILPMGQASALVSETLGTPRTIGTVIGSTTSAVNIFYEPLRQFYADNWSKYQEAIKKIDLSYRQGGSSQFYSNDSADNNIVTSSAQEKIGQGQPNDYSKPGETSDPFYKFLVEASKHPEVLDEVSLADLDLPESSQIQIDAIMDSVLSLTTSDMIAKRDSMIDFARSISESFGGGSASYNSVKGYGTPVNTYKKLTTDDIYILNELNNAIVAMDTVISTMDEADAIQDDYYSFYADYAVTKGLKFEKNNQSRFLVPFPMGATLEQVASRYLGSAERWIELAALNALKAPYVDETGRFIQVTASAGGDTLTIADATGLYVGQSVEILSDIEKATTRKIKTIDTVSAVSVILTFEPGPVLLTKYKVSQNARIKVYAPDTINSNMLIAIPSLTPPNFKVPLKTSPEVNELSGVARVAKVDFLLNQDGDLVFSSGGDIKLAYGMTNLVQAALMKVKTSTGTLLQDPNFGNPAQVGNNIAEVDAKAILQDLSTMFANDERFTGLTGGEVAIKGNAIDIKILVGVSDTSISLPIGAEIPK